MPTADNPAVSEIPNATFAAWIAPPDAPLVRLSMAHMTITVFVRSSYRAVICALFDPSVALVEGEVGRTTTNGSLAYALAKAASNDCVVGVDPVGLA